jgi:SRSO17 transposase
MLSAMGSAGMDYEMDAAAVARLEAYFAQIGTCLRDRRKRESFALYAAGLLGEGERKSAEPIAARACGDPEKARCTHDKVLHFLGRAAWDDRAVRRVAVRYALAAMSVREPVTTWVIDDTGFLKQGKDSVGVQRQYTGSAGKVTNCQVGVSLSVATRTEHLPIDFALYLPTSWTEDPARRAKAKIPASIPFQTKIELALGMVEQAVVDEIPGDIVLADSAYGDSHAFRERLRQLGLDYAVGIHAPTKVWCLDARERRRGKPLGVQQLGVHLGLHAFRRLTWREGPGGKLSSRFCFRRVKVAQDDGLDPAEHEPLWLLMEWPDGEAKPTKFALTTLPRRMTKKRIVRIFKERWRTERVYEELKGELGLDHFEGRSFIGWHHHVSVVLCCFAFVIAERVQHFPPSAGRQASTHAFAVAA